MSEPDIGDLQSRVDALRKSTAEPQAGDVTPSNPGGLAFRFAIDIVAGVGVGGTMGYFIDRWLGTMPLFLLICLGLGMAGSFMTVYRANLRYAADVEKENASQNNKT